MDSKIKLKEYLKVMLNEMNKNRDSNNYKDNDNYDNYNDNTDNNDNNNYNNTTSSSSNDEDASLNEDPLIFNNLLQATLTPAASTSSQVFTRAMVSYYKHY